MWKLMLGIMLLAYGVPMVTVGASAPIDRVLCGVGGVAIGAGASLVANTVEELKK